MTARLVWVMDEVCCVECRTCGSDIVSSAADVLWMTSS